jgi:hypothetical protein
MPLVGLEQLCVILGNIIICNAGLIKLRHVMRCLLLTRESFEVPLLCLS